MLYPANPGWKASGDTSQEAGERIAGHAKTVRGRVLGFLTKHHPRTFNADEIAAALGENILTVRPRVSELRRSDLIEPTADRRLNQSGMRATCCRAKGRLVKPDPLTPPDCDLRDFSWMPLDVIRLRDSDLTVLLSGEAFRAAVLLWCAAWHQIPAASIPTDDRILAKLAGYGRDVESWAKVRDDALHGFVECSDGRLYHPVVAEKALEANDQRQKQKERTQKATEARLGGSRNAKLHDKRNVHRYDQRDDSELADRNGSRNEVQQTGPDRTGEDQTKHKSKNIRNLLSLLYKETPDGTTTTKVAEGIGLQAMPVEASNNPLGTALPETWVPDDGCIEVAHDHGMTDGEIDSEVLRFHAFNAQRGTFSQSWSKTWTLWCVEFGRRKTAEVAKEAAKAPPRVEINHQTSDKDWHSAVQRWKRNNSHWSRHLGPEPGMIGCRCPATILTSEGIDSATGRRLPTQVQA
ncbi:DUF1376 domain-containing protein [Bradyrhizobium sp. RDM12]